MFDVTSLATRELKEFFKDKELQPLRVFLKEHTCGGPRLILGVSEQNEDDTVFEIDGLTYIIETGFFKKIQPVVVDFVGDNFKVAAGVSFGDGEGCGGCSSAGSCS